jgi:hypothetical protein
MGFDNDVGTFNQRLYMGLQLLNVEKAFIVELFDRHVGLNYFIEFLCLVQIIKNQRLPLEQHLP